MCCDILFILLYIRVTYPGTYMIARFMFFYKPGVTKTEQAWVREDLRIMRDPPVAFAGLGAA